MNSDDRKRAEEAARLSEERFRTALKGSPIVVFNQDRDLRYTWVHDGGHSLGFDSPMGKTDAELWDRPEEAEAARLIKQRVLTTGEPERTELVAHLKGVRHVYDLTLEPLRGVAGDVIGLTGASVDITERKQVEERLRQSAKMEAIGQLAGGLAHDLNNQLQGLSGLVQFVARDPGLSEASSNDLVEIQNATERMAGLTRQILAFSRQQVLVAETLDINSAVVDIKPMLQRLVGSNLEMRVDLAPEPSWVRVDRSQLLQVLMNLVINARDAMPGGGQLRIGVDTRQVRGRELDALARGPVAKGSYVELVVQDSGTGIPSQDLERIFEPFYTTKPVGEGTGLGLATVDGILTQSRGYIWAESTLGSGSTFRALLPLVDPPVPSEPIAPTRSELGTARGTLLVVDDEELVLHVIVRTLELDGYQVIQASNGQEALEILMQRGGAVDLVVSDVVMPVMGGTALGDALAKHYPALKIIWMSGYSREAVSSQGRLGEEVPFLQKPISPALLSATVSKALEARA